MERLKSTQNYVYSLDDLVGKGATCEVYKGIHKESGKICALKVFGLRLRIVAQREIEALRHLKHENIVDFIHQESEQQSGRVVAVMEYCDKSLWTALNEPENRYGLQEDEFMRFFTHIVEGMKHLREHGFLHRDIKPGNILMVQDDYGNNIYKLSDFGTAKPVMATELFQSLVGTEEYLHPNIFRAAFIDQAMSREFDAAADLWSLGATLYHAATGKVPFQPYKGRDDKLVMYQMIAQKEHGVIAGEQRTEKGEVIWTKELPKTCRMSRWLKSSLTEIFKQLLEIDPNYAMTFDTFFDTASDIISRCVIYVFSTTSAKHFRLYMKPDCTYSHLQQEINEETNIPPKDQHIHYEECLLSDVVKETDPVCDYPKLKIQMPLVLIRSTLVEQCTMPDEKQFWYSEQIAVPSPTFDDTIFIDKDFRTAKAICDSIALIQTYIEQGCLTQELFEKIIQRTERWKEVLVNHLQMEVSLYIDRITDLYHINAAITENGGTLFSLPTDGVFIQDLMSQSKSCFNRMKKIQDTQMTTSNKLYVTCCVDGQNCQKKIARLLQQAKGKRDAIEARKKAHKSLPFHEEKLHKFDREFLLKNLQTAMDLWTTHCQKMIAKFHSYFLEWHNFFANLQTQIEILQKEIRRIKSSLKKFVRLFCKNKVSSSLASIDDCSLVSRHASSSSLESESKQVLCHDVHVQCLMNGSDKVKTDQEDFTILINENKDLCLKTMNLMTENEVLLGLPQ